MQAKNPWRFLGASENEDFWLWVWMAIALIVISLKNTFLTLNK